MITLTAWLREQLDSDESSLQAGLVEHLGSRPENDYRFRLAEVDAKRRIIEALALEWNDGMVVRGPEDETGWMVVQLLALPYAEREGYREEWRP